jgi:hypothetical protein
MYFNEDIDRISSLLGIDSHRNFSDSDVMEKFQIAERYAPLIDKCIIGKPLNLVSEKELKALGKLALLSFNIDSFSKVNFPSMAVSRIEKYMNKAIAEAIFIKKLNKETSKSEVCAEFTSINKRFS